MGKKKKEIIKIIRKDANKQMILLLATISF
jgi:hypothetical protein